MSLPIVTKPGPSVPNSVVLNPVLSNLGAPKIVGLVGSRPIVVAPSISKNVTFSDDEDDDDDDDDGNLMPKFDLDSSSDDDEDNALFNSDTDTDSDDDDDDSDDGFKPLKNSKRPQQVASKTGKDSVVLKMAVQQPVGLKMSVVTPGQNSLPTPLSQMSSRVSTTSVQPVALKTPVQPVALKTPVQPVALKTPVQPVALKTPVQPVALKTPVQPVALKTPVQPVALKTPVQPVALKTPTVSSTGIVQLEGLKATTPTKAGQVKPIGVNLPTTSKPGIVQLVGLTTPTIPALKPLTDTKSQGGPVDKTIDIKSLLSNLPGITISGVTKVPGQEDANIEDLLKKEADESPEDFEARKILTLKLAAIEDYKLNNVTAVTVAHMMMKKSRLGLAYDTGVESALSYLSDLLMRQ
jgi:hypothetical protein